MTRSVRVAIAGLVVAAVAFVAMVLAVAALSPAPVLAPTQKGPPPAASGLLLSIANETSIVVTLVVNGIVIERVAPGGYEDPVTAVLPALPWSVEARSPSGRVLSRMMVHEGDVAYTTPDANGHSSAQGRAVRVDLSCGRLDVWSGPPMLGPAPGPGTPGDCD